MNQTKIIAQEIDIAIIGSRSYELTSIILGKKMDLETKKCSKQYLNSIKKLLSLNQKTNFETSNKVSNKNQRNRLKKFTKSVITESFWINFHFFIHDASLYDPFLTQVVKGNSSICILASSENSAEIGQIKNLLNEPSIFEQRAYNNSQKIIGCFNLGNLANHQAIKEVMMRPGSKMEAMIQGKILDLVHKPSIAGFASLLALRINEDSSRIIQDSSNLKLNSNQILRWIVQRHFENRYHLKIRQSLGDQLQNYLQLKPVEGCCLI